MAPMTFCARRAAACAVTYSYPMKRATLPGRRLPSRMNAVTAPTSSSARWRVMRRRESGR